MKRGTILIVLMLGLGGCYTTPTASKMDFYNQELSYCIEGQKESYELVNVNFTNEEGKTVNIVIKDLPWSKNMIIDRRESAGFQFVVYGKGNLKTTMLLNGRELGTQDGEGILKLYFWNQPID